MINSMFIEMIKLFRKDFKNRTQYIINKYHLICPNILSTQTLPVNGDFSSDHKFRFVTKSAVKHHVYYCAKHISVHIMNGSVLT